MKKICLNINKEKSAILINESKENSTDNNEFESNLPVIGNKNPYKYLGMLQDKVINQKINKEKIINEINRRINLIGNTYLNFRNLRTAMRETCSSLINYSSGLLEWTTNELNEINNMQIRLLKKMKYQHRNSNKTRIFLKKEKGGLGLTDVEFSHDTQIIKLNNSISIKCSKNIEFISKIGSMTPITIFKQYKNLLEKYKIEENDSGFELEKIKKNYENKIENNIKEKKLHSIYFNSLNRNGIDRKTSCCWLNKSNTSPKVVSNLVALQDRTIFNNILRDDKGYKMCFYCKKKKISIDHLATKCTSLLDKQYKQRHDNLTKMIHFNLMKKIAPERKISLCKYKPETIFENDNGKIFFECQFTDIKRHTNRPDLIFYDKRKQCIFLIEIGVSSPDCLKKREIQKRLKYNRLSKMIYLDTKVKTLVTPVVISWDGIVTTNFMKNLDCLELTKIAPLLLKSVIRNSFGICKIVCDRKK